VTFSKTTIAELVGAGGGWTGSWSRTAVEMASSVCWRSGSCKGGGSARPGAPKSTGRPSLA